MNRSSLLLGLVLAGAPAARAQAPLPLDAGWTLLGDARPGVHLGRPALRIRTGRAIRPDVSLRDGTIDFDLAVTRHRSFVYLQFRMASNAEYEEFYFRPHKSELPDAVQYGPVWNGEGQWQLYHGPGFTAATPFPADQWFHVRVVVQGSRAAVFVGDTARPVMVVPRLARAPVAGPIAIRSFVPAGGAPEGVIAAGYTNLVVRPGYVPFDFSTVPVTEPRVADIIPAWRFSAPFAPEDWPARRLPAAVTSGTTWQTLQAEPSGLVTIGRTIHRPSGDRAAVLAEATVRADSAGLYRLNLGFSDDVTVFVNGVPHYAGDASYSFNFPRQEGLIGLGQAVLYLPLRAGDNRLQVLVGEVFGGWGLMGQMAGVSFPPP